MHELETTKGVRGIVFISGKPENFLAGANLKLISQIETAEEVLRTIDRFHSSFNRLSNWEFPPLRPSTATASEAVWNLPSPAPVGSPRKGRRPSSACRSAMSASFPAPEGRSVCPG